eukprot:6008179-Ditylum_brightwellii.AAC.1
MHDVCPPTVPLSDLGKLPPDLGSFPNIHSSRGNTTPLPHPLTYLHTGHVDIGFDNTVAPGGIKYCLLFVDCRTQHKWIYSLKSIKCEELCRVFEQFRINAGAWPKKHILILTLSLLMGHVEISFVQKRLMSVPLPEAGNTKIV